MHGASDGLVIETAAEAQAPAALALLPGTRGLGATWLLARQDGELAGAAAICWRPIGRPEGLPIDVRVLPRHCGRGIGRALLAGAVALAAEETCGFWAFRAVAPRSGAARFLEECGFAARRTEFHFQAEIRTFLDHLSPLAARMRASGRLPADTSIIDLADAPLDEIAWMVSADLGGGPFEMIARLRRRLRGETDGRDRSQVAMRRERAAGVVLWRIQDGVAIIDGRVISRGADRGTWVNLALLEAGLRRGEADGVTEFRFHCDDTARDTLSLAERCGARVTEVRLGYYLELMAGA